MDYVDVGGHPGVRKSRLDDNAVTVALEMATVKFLGLDDGAWSWCGMSEGSWRASWQ
jgi:hypothetical protein